MDFDQQEILLEFIDESRELLDVAGSDVMALEKNWDVETVNRIYRAFHSIKGNSQMLGFEQIGDLAHELENLLSQVRNRSLDLEKGNADLLLRAIDLMSRMIADIAAGSPQAAEPGPMVAEVRALVEKGHGRPTGPAALHTKTERAERASSQAEQETEPVRPKILLVEDEFVSRQLLLSFMSRIGECHVAKDGLEAVQAFIKSSWGSDARPYDLICMDIVMPQLNGLEATRTIREIERGKGVEGTENEAVIVVVSAQDDPGTIMRATYECGANHFFSKPLDFNQMSRQLVKLGLLKNPLQA